MKRSQSMENLPMLPEEAKMAASLLRLTLSDKQETATESEFQTYISQHSHFPYHKAVPLTMVQRKSSQTATCKPVIANQCSKDDKLESLQVPRKRVLRRRCESSPSSFSPKEVEIAESAVRSCQYPSSEPEGFFKRLIPSFLRKKRVAEINNNSAYDNIGCDFAQTKQGKVPEQDSMGRFEKEIIFMTRNDMGNFIFMSMR